MEFAYVVFHLSDNQAGITGQLVELKGHKEGTPTHFGFFNKELPETSHYFLSLFVGKEVRLFEIDNRKQSAIGHDGFGLLEQSGLTGWRIQYPYRPRLFMCIKQESERLKIGARVRRS